ncbi:hypothetical protein T05_14041 [Trichinella murrelli]|uniref:Uncharacterized protein n=1 Tax=Trichinella murrelli TaxID=144512 RepID=A0A0V0TMS7_9BILA|nr:hypothetical protein T05_14041 [Trichinella murrelli]
MEANFRQFREPYLSTARVTTSHNRESSRMKIEQLSSTLNFEGTETESRNQKSYAGLNSYEVDILNCSFINSYAITQF